MQNAKTKKIKWALSLAIAILVCLALYVFATSSQNDLKTVDIGGAQLNVEIAKTSQQKQQGLCCRESLDADSGMLFVYYNPGDYRFWMKDTLIPLDIIWISPDKTIVHIEADVKPASFPETFGSSQPAQYVLETNAGWAAKNGVEVGDRVSL